MSYIDAFHDIQHDNIHVIERVNGIRVHRTYQAVYIFYYSDANGHHESIFGDPLSKFETHNFKTFQREKAIKSASHKIFESDLNVVFRCLADHYSEQSPPDLHIGFIDIEVAFDVKRGHALPKNPHCKVTAISIYHEWKDYLATMVYCPPTLSMDEARSIASQYENTTVYDDEVDLFQAFFATLSDVDIISGWNSEGYDLPYLVNRVALIMGQDATRNFCQWNQLPRKRKYPGKFGQVYESYECPGLVHLDSLQLYQKFTQQQQASFSLDATSDRELGERKIPYAGTLDDLYKKDFSKFIAYNRQDTMLLAKIDAKKKFIALANQIAHNNTVLLKTAMGSVALVEQAIINEMHAKGKIVPDRRRELKNDDIEDEDDTDDAEA